MDDAISWDRFVFVGLRSTATISPIFLLPTNRGDIVTGAGFRVCHTWDCARVLLISGVAVLLEPFGDEFRVHIPVRCPPQLFACGTQDFVPPVVFDLV